MHVHMYIHTYAAAKQCLLIHIYLCTYVCWCGHIYIVPTKLALGPHIWCCPETRLRDLISRSSCVTYSIYSAILCCDYVHNFVFLHACSVVRLAVAPGRALYPRLGLTQLSLSLYTSLVLLYVLVPLFGDDATHLCATSFALWSLFGLFSGVWHSVARRVPCKFHVFGLVLQQFAGFNF